MKFFNWIVDRVMFPGVRPSYDMAMNEGLFWLRLAPHHRIPCLLHPYLQGSPFLIIYAHGNGSDIGDLLDRIRELSMSLQAHVLSFDYPAYGCADGKANAASVDATCNCVLEFVLKNLSWPVENVILFGCSIGTGPMTRLAHKISLSSVAERTQDRKEVHAHYQSALSSNCRAFLTLKHLKSTCNETPTDLDQARVLDATTKRSSTDIVSTTMAHRRLGGLILQCPYKSIRHAAARYVGSLMAWMFVEDCWNVSEEVSGCTCPLLLIHGKKDEIFDWHETQTMYNRYKHQDKMLYLAELATHFNFEYERDVIPPVQHFIQTIVSKHRRPMKQFSTVLHGLCTRLKFPYEAHCSIPILSPSFRDVFPTLMDIFESFADHQHDQAQDLGLCFHTTHVPRPEDLPFHLPWSPREASPPSAKPLSLDRRVLLAPVNWIPVHSMAFCPPSVQPMYRKGLGHFQQLELMKAHQFFSYDDQLKAYESRAAILSKPCPSFRGVECKHDALRDYIFQEFKLFGAQLCHNLLRSGTANPKAMQRHTFMALLGYVRRMYALYFRRKLSLELVYKKLPAETDSLSEFGSDLDIHPDQWYDDLHASDQSTDSQWSLKGLILCGTFMKFRAKLGGTFELDPYYNDPHFTNQTLNAPLSGNDYLVFPVYTAPQADMMKLTRWLVVAMNQIKRYLHQHTSSVTFEAVLGCMDNFHQLKALSDEFLDRFFQQEHRPDLNLLECISKGTNHGPTLISLPQIFRAWEKFEPRIHLMHSEALSSAPQPRRHYVRLRDDMPFVDAHHRSRCFFVHQLLKYEIGEATRQSECQTANNGMANLVDPTPGRKAYQMGRSKPLKSTLQQLSFFRSSRKSLPSRRSSMTTQTDYQLLKPSHDQKPSQPDANNHKSISSISTTESFTTSPVHPPELYSGKADPVRGFVSLDSQLGSLSRNFPTSEIPLPLIEFVSDKQVLGLIKFWLNRLDPRFQISHVPSLGLRPTVRALIQDRQSYMRRCIKTEAQLGYSICYHFLFHLVLTRPNYADTQTYATIDAFWRFMETMTGMTDILVCRSDHSRSVQAESPSTQTGVGALSLQEADTTKETKFLINLVLGISFLQRLISLAEEAFDPKAEHLISLETSLYTTFQQAIPNVFEALLPGIVNPCVRFFDELRSAVIHQHLTLPFANGFPLMYATQVGEDAILASTQCYILDQIHILLAIFYEVLELVDSEGPLEATAASHGSLDGKNSSCLASAYKPFWWDCSFDWVTTWSVDTSYAKSESLNRC